MKAIKGVQLNFFAPLLAIGVTACVINPSTGQPEFSSSVKIEFTDIFDNPDPC